MFTLKRGKYVQTRETTPNSFFARVMPHFGLRIYRKFLSIFNTPNIMRAKCDTIPSAYTMYRRLE